MGTKQHCKSYFPGFFSMRDLNENSSTSSWPVFYGDKEVSNGQYYNGSMPRTLVKCYPGDDKDTLKQKMLEHEAVFKNQVCELHRVYRIQRDMMEEVKRKEFHKRRESMEPASSSSHQGPEVPSEDASKWHMACFPLLNSSYSASPMVVVENLNSPVCCMKGIITRPDESPFLNVSTSKDSEAFASRPLKLRKKLFDLQVPADRYVDLENEENLRGYKESDFLRSMKYDVPADNSASTSCLRGSIGLADLNEPAQIEEATAPSSIDFLSHTSENAETRTIHQPAKLAAGYLGVIGDTMLMRDGLSTNSSCESQVNERGLFSHVQKAGSSVGNLSSVAQGCRSDKLLLQNPNGYGREDLWKEGIRRGLEPSGRSYVHSNCSHLEPTVSRTPGSHPFFSSSSFASSWIRPVSSWAKPAANGFYYASSSGSKELRVQPLSSGFGYLNCSRDDNVASERSNNHGLRDFAKCPYRADSKPKLDINLNEALPRCSLDDTVILQDVSSADGKSKPRDDLWTLPWLKHKSGHVSEVSDTCRSELSREMSSLHASSIQFSCKNGAVGVTLTSCDSEIPREKETAQTRTVEKILGVPVFERDVPENEQSSHASTSYIACHAEEKIVGKERNNGMIDINVACQPDEQIADEQLTLEKEKQGNGTSIKDCIDLNICVNDYEDNPPPCYEQKSSSVKITLEIDLEDPVFLESEYESTLSKEKIADEVSWQTLENQHKQVQDEALRNAAEAIVAISSCPITGAEASMEEALIWFVDAVCSHENDTANLPGKESTFLDSSEVDEFEAMTLQLSETKEEDYMPKTFVPEIHNAEEKGPNALTARPRRGHSRRGRQRRDFRRDILPGLASLSRHEVTEDLQTFGGLMRATGHSWNLGLARRNGGARGRRRAAARNVQTAHPSPVFSSLVQQVNTTEAGLEDRSLTGWGKTTRRPRRQRCPAGNHPTVALT